MTKTTTTPAAAFTAGDRVAVSNAATLGEPLAGTIATIKSGWYIVELDDEIENAKGEATNTLSARASSLAPLEDDTDGEDEIDGEYSDDLDENGNAIPLDDEQSVEEALDEAEEHASKMAEALRKARARYVKDRRPNGAATAHNGDTIAKELRDYEPEEVCALADRCLDLPKGFHAARYDGLNNGQKRMNAGNKIRGAWKKAEKDGDTATLERIKFVLGLDDEQDAE